jgi:hypothetical protein
LARGTRQSIGTDEFQTEAMMRLNTHRSAILALTLATATTTLARAASAQIPTLHPSFYGSGEADTRSSEFYLLGMYVGVGGLGWSPYFNVNGWGLHYQPIPGNSATSTMSAVSPTLGLAYASRSRGVSFGAGYNWVHNPNAAAPGAEGGGTNGVTASLGAYNNGTRRRGMRTQLLANYNFDSRYAWIRGRASTPFGSSTRRPARLGLEVVGQGGGKNGITTNQFGIGPTLEYTWSPNFRTTGVVGYKSVGGDAFANRDNAAYFKLEFSLSP